MPVVARLFDVFPHDSVDISCADRRENEGGKRERKKTTDYHCVSILLIDARRRLPI